MNDLSFEISFIFFMLFSKNNPLTFILQYKISCFNINFIQLIKQLLTHPNNKAQLHQFKFFITLIFFIWVQIQLKSKSVANLQNKIILYQFYKYKRLKRTTMQQNNSDSTFENLKESPTKKQQIQILNSPQKDNIFDKLKYYLNKKIILIVVFGSLAIIIALVYAFFVPDQNSVFDLVLLQDPEALCLDGSPGAYYISRQGDLDKIYIQFQGGGWCGDQQQNKDTSTVLQNCYQRSKKQLGGSNSYQIRRNFNQGFLSLNQNNYFRNWKKVFLTYCDGTFHQGKKTMPIYYKQKYLYFRGHQITIGQFNSLNQQIKLFSNPSQIVIGGGSAGGVSAHLWINYVVENAPNANVRLVTDSSIFYNTMNINTGLFPFQLNYQSLIQFSNQQIDPPVPECVLQFSNSKHNCFFTQNIYKYVKAPSFYIQSLYDRYEILFNLGIKCVLYNGSFQQCNSNQKTYLQNLRVDVTNLLLQIKNIPQNGIWGQSCFHHVYVYNRETQYYNKKYRIPQNSQFSVSQSLKEWMNNNPSYHIDLMGWPSNQPCSGI